MNFNGRKGCVPTSMQILMCVQLEAASIDLSVTAKPVLSGHLKLDTNKKDLRGKW